ncbi:MULTISPECIES: hypothetical protein [Pseudomonas]|nr:hypothetical protein [Pseudomonas putida]MCI0913212.1 hypothetical protein [Pseudomonas putida]
MTPLSLWAMALCLFALWVLGLRRVAALAQHILSNSVSMARSPHAEH